MSRKPIFSVIASVILVLTPLILLRLSSSVYVGSTVGSVGAQTVSVIGRYQSDSAYSMVEVYGDGASVFVSPFLWNMAYPGG